MVEFSINNHVWTCTLYEPDEDTVHTCGSTNYVYNEILINKDLNKESLKSTIIHEITHAFRWSYGFVNDIAIQNIPTAHMEEIIANFVEYYSKDILELSDLVFKQLEKERHGRSSKKS